MMTDKGIQMNLFDKVSQRRGAKLSLVAMDCEQSMLISYSFADTLFGRALLASTDVGLCYLAFEEDEHSAIDNLKKRFSKANLMPKSTDIHGRALEVISKDSVEHLSLSLAVSGTDFQLQVWNALLKIPFGETCTYSQLAEQIGLPSTASRAVGTAVGSNDIAFLIPCHRVVQKGGALGGYKWGLERKKALLAWESA